MANTSEPFPARRLSPKLRNIPTPAHAKHSPILKHICGQAQKATSQGTHPVTDLWMLDHESPRGTQRMRRPCVRTQVRRMGASARNVAWSARLQESNHAQAY